MSAQRSGRGKPIDPKDWPASGKKRDWLVYCDRVHRDNGLRSLTVLAAALNMTSRTRVSEMLRGLSLPVNDDQARDLLVALGAEGGPEIDRGLRLYRAARVERAQAKGSDWWLRSGYMQQVSDIAPLELLDRQDELAELADWCTSGDEAYAWWQGPPRAGKSALMSWFVLHPPPGVWVVSFFVTARYTGQADSTAFTDELIDQLAAITGQKIPSVTSIRERHRVRRQLLDAAAARVMQTNRRLVLLVDGLDEDCGSLPGSGLPSIAKCLPKHPTGEVKVIVAGRPDPPLPADILVDPDHPLLNCRVRVLDASPHARQVMQLAQNELDQVLATDPDRHDGLGYQVLGLVTASGGGLSYDDLQQLTGRPKFELDRLLCGVFGRTIAGRADPHAIDRVFLFTHETLRKQAIERLGPDTLAGFAERLHIWATSYQRRSWPANTPVYLLRGYPRMLADTNDLDRLTALATDPARHHRMLDVTGGDAAALADIATAQALVGKQPSPDLLAALRLAWYRDQLADRNTNIPTQLPAVWATIGQPIRAEALARSITDPNRQVWALTDLASMAATAGDHDRARALATDAEQMARTITDQDRQAQALIALAGVVALAGDHDGAADLARSITDLGRRAKALTAVAGAVTVAGDSDRAHALIGEAERTARSINDLDWRAEALTAVAGAVTAAGDSDRAHALFREAERTVGSINDLDWRAEALTAAADVVAVGDQYRVQASAAEAEWDETDAEWDETDAEWVARNDKDPNRKTQALIDLAQTAATAGDHERVRLLTTEAELVARSITDSDKKAQTLADLARVVAAAGDHDRARSLATNAEQIARSITDSGRTARALTDLIRVLAAAGDHERADVLARSLADPDRQAWILTALVVEVAAAGDHEGAVALARSIMDQDWQARALTDLLGVVAAAGDYDRARALAVDAEQIARSMIDPSQQARVLTALAGAVATAGDYDRTRALATDAEQIARSIMDPSLQAWILTALARAVAVAGDQDRAEHLACSIADSDRQALALIALARVAAADDHDRVRALAAHVEQLCRTVADPGRKAQALTDLVGVVAATGDHNRAEALARSITDPDRQARALTDLAGAVAATGDHNRAEALARSITDPDRRAWALTGLVEVAALHHDRVQVLATEVEQLCRSMTDSARTARALTDLAKAVAMAGDHDRAEAIAHSIADPDHKAQALTELASFAEVTRARSSTANALAAGRWTIALKALARIDSMALSVFVDECVQPAPPGTIPVVDHGSFKIVSRIRRGVAGTERAVLQARSRDRRT